MKTIIAAFLVALAMPVHAYDSNDPFGKRAKSAKWYKEKYEHYEPDYSHREMMQTDIDRAAAAQRRADEIMSRNKPQTIDFLLQACRDASAAQVMTNYGYFNAREYSKLYGNCLKEIGVNQ